MTHGPGLSGAVGLVTGAGSGIGRAIARRLASEGATVVVGDRSGAGAAETVELVGERGRVAVCDVTDTEAVDAMIASTVRDLGGLDVLVNNAGIADATGDELQRWNEAVESPDDAGKIDFTRHLTDAAWERMLDVNLTGTLRCCRAALGVMLPRGRGSIINIASVAALNGIAGAPHYCAAKAGVLGLTRALAREAGPYGVRVNAICPGMIDTPMAAQLSAEAVRSAAAATSVGRIGTAEEVAGVVAFLASDDARYVTGQTVTVDGGARS